MATCGHESGQSSPLDKKCGDLSTLYVKLFPACAKWYNIGLNLMLSNDVLEKIGIAQHDNTENCLREMLAKRLQAVGPLSWKEVCNCLRSSTVTRNDVAEEIEDWRKETAGNAHSQSFVTVSPFSKSATGSVTDFSSLEDQVKHLESKFQLLTNEAYQLLKQSGVSIDDFYATISSMKLSLKHLAGKYVRECFMKTSNFSMIWGDLNQFWDFFNCELFQHVVRVMFTEDDNPLPSKLAEYENELEIFLHGTKLCDFVEYWPFTITKPKQTSIKKLKRVIITVYKKWEDCTLHDVKKTRRIFSKEFSLPKEFMVLVGVSEGSVCILWYVPPSLASSIEQQVKQGKSGFLADNSFLSINIDGVQLDLLTPGQKRMCTSMLNSLEDKDQLTVFHWLFKRGYKVYIADILKERKMRIHVNNSWSDRDFFVASYCIARSNCAWVIDFSGSSIEDTKMTLFLQALCCVNRGEQGNAFIISIDFRSNDLTSQSLRYMQDIPAHFLHHLKTLDVSHNNLDGTAMAHIAKAIPHMPSLNSLDLSWNPIIIQRGGAACLLSALCDHNALKKLNLSGTNIAHADCEQLARLLCSSQCLESLDVSGNFLSSNSVHTLLRGLQLNSSLTQLDVSHNSISLEAMMTLCTYLGDDDKCKLETLDLWGSNISPESAIELAHGLSRNCSVKELSVSYNPLGDSGVAALGIALETNKTITELELFDCSITTVGGAALASSLMANSTIEELNISHNSLGGEAIQRFADLIQHNDTLKRLDTSEDDSLTQSDIDILFKSLANNLSLEELRLPYYLKLVENTDQRVVWW